MIVHLDMSCVSVTLLNLVQHGMIAGQVNLAGIIVDVYHCNKHRLTKFSLSFGIRLQFVTPFLSKY